MIKKFTSLMAMLMAFVISVSPAFASEADLLVPDVKAISPDSYTLLLVGIGVAVAGLIFGLWKFWEVKKMDVHSAMAAVGNTIFETCKTYLIQQGKFLLVLEILIDIVNPQLTEK